MTTGPSRPRRRGIALSLLAAAALATLAVLLAHEGDGDGAARAPASDPRAGGAPPALAVPPAVSPAADATRSRRVDLRLAFPSRARLESSVLVTLREGARECGSFLVETDARRVVPSSLEAEGGTLAVVLARVDAEAAAVTVRLDGVPAVADSVEARTVDRVVPVLATQAEPIPRGDAVSVALRLAVTDASGWLAVRVLRDGEAVDDVDLELLRGTEALRRHRTGDRRSPALRVPADEALRLVVLGYPGSALLGLPDPVEVSASARRIVDVDIHLPPGRRVSVVAKDRHGEQTPFSLSLWRAGDDGRRSHVGLRGLLEPDPELRVWRGRLAPGAYVAVADPRAHHAPASLRFEVAPPDKTPADRAAETVVVVPVTDGGVRTRLRLSRADGTRLARTLVNVNRETDVVESLAAHVGTTDADGELVTPPLPPGRYLLHAWSEGLATRLDLGDGSPVERVLPAPCVDGCASLSGSVLEPDGTPARWPKVFLWRPDGWAHVSAVDANGRYAFPRLFPGPYDLEVSASPYSENSYVPARASVSLGSAESVRREFVLHTR